jgi:hypothetical protein
LRPAGERWYRGSVGSPPSSLQRRVRSSPPWLALLPSLALLSCSYPDFLFAPSTPPGACDDRITNGLETDTDCGGPSCGGCSDGRPCLEGRDCASLVCIDAVCQAPACSDGVRNGTETGSDCGGNCEGRCPAGEACVGGADCASLVCRDGLCQAPSCGDSTTNGGESDRDCGGGSCEGCENREACNVPSDCLEGLCDQNTCVAEHCTNDDADEDESDVDCGGSACARCAIDASCSEAGDCQTMVCEDGTCLASSCHDGVKNGEESDEDCGGPDCGPCPDRSDCSSGMSCVSGVCQGGQCQPPSCTDSVKNGDETDTDCGAACPEMLCADGKDCADGQDCASGVCTGTCQEVGCDDGSTNGGETDTDCGGPCQPCEVGGACDSNADCASNSCSPDGCSDALKLLYLTDAPNSSVDWIRPFFKIRNDGPETLLLSDFEIRYFFTADTDVTQLGQCFLSNVDCYNVALAVAAFDPPTTTADHYYSITFSAVTIAGSGTEATVESGFHRDPYGYYDQSNDYSFDPAKTSYAFHDKAVLYRKGVVVWGTPP